MDGADKTAISISGIVGLVVLLGTGLIVYGCQNANQKYYDMAHTCIAAGGSFIPTGSQGGYVAVCVKPNQSP
jgi:hypothetical protein